MDIRKVKKLIELLEQSGISEIEISEGEESVRISRHPQPGAVGYLAPPAPIASPQAPASQPAAPEPPPRNHHEVTAPMVGTFYAQPDAGRQALRGDRHRSELRATRFASSKR